MVHLPNSTRLRSTHTAMLKLPQLTRAGKTVRLFRDTELTFPLLSVGQFCDADCAAHIDKHEMRICDPTGTCFLREERDRTTGLYLAPLPGFGTTASTPKGSSQLPKYPRQINMGIRAKTEVDQVRFGIETMGSPTTPTVTKAVAAVFLTKIPGMSLQALRRHPPDSIKNGKRPFAPQSPGETLDQTVHPGAGYHNDARRVPWTPSDTRIGQSSPTRQPPYPYTVHPDLQTDVHRFKWTFPVQVHLRQ
jgi:hypothetical protein